jgi:hypothetical protein
MSSKNILFIVLITIFFTFCDSSDNIVGTNNDVEIKNVSFTIDTTYLQSSVLYAKGTVTNLGKTTIESPWYVEAQFYTDSTYKLKMGGNYTMIGVPLEPYQSTFWSISFSTTKIDVNQYPNFRISDLRAIYKK